MTENEKRERLASEPIRLQPLQGFAEFWRAVTVWSESTFGGRASRGPIGPLKHLAKEAQEAWQETDLAKRDEEIADCLFLVIDAANRAGMKAGDLLAVAWRKLEKNKARTWPKSVGDEPTEHVKVSDNEAIHTVES